jgi:AcrR family transcriptional regulator
VAKAASDPGKLRKSNSGARRDLVSNEILESAAALFAERGFAATSLQEVADALGLSRTALYHYIGSKDELLSQLVEGLPSQTADALLKISKRKDLTPLERVGAAIQDMTERVTANPARFRLLLLSFGDLSPELRARFRKARLNVLERLTTMIAEAIDEGEMRPVDPELAAFAILGMCNWAAWWFRGQEEGAHAVDEIVDLFCGLTLDGLRSDPSRQATATGKGPAHALSLLRADLDYLERSLSRTRRGS